jgi:hypothetical protein
LNRHETLPSVQSARPKRPSGVHDKLYDITGAGANVFPYRLFAYLYRVIPTGWSVPRGATTEAIGCPRGFRFALPTLRASEVSPLMGKLTMLDRALYSWQRDVVRLAGYPSKILIRETRHVPS